MEPRGFDISLSDHGFTQNGAWDGSPDNIFVINLREDKEETQDSCAITDDNQSDDEEIKPYLGGYEYEFVDEILRNQKCQYGVESVAIDFEGECQQRILMETLETLHCLKPERLK